MTLNKKKLFFGIVLGSLGVSFYKSYKNYKETSEYMKKATSKHSTNSTECLKQLK